MTNLAPYLATLTSSNGQLYGLAVIVILALLLLTRRLGAVYFVTTFPVTLAHELTHLLLGFVTHGQPCGFRVWPQRSARGYVLGSVTCRNVRWYNGLFIGFAPVILLPCWHCSSGACARYRKRMRSKQPGPMRWPV